MHTRPRRGKQTRSGDPSAGSRREAWGFRAGVLAVIVLLLLGSVLAVSSLVRSASSPATPSSSSPATPIHHVFVIQMENQDLSTVLAQGPYQASLYHTYGGASAYYGVCHPSASNYLAATSGQSLQCGSDAVVSYPVSNVADLLNAKGESWVGYMEAMPSPCDRSNSGGYVAHHDPFIYYKDITSNSSYCASHVLPLSDFNPSQTPPNFVWVSPDGTDNGHLSVASGDTWLKSFLSPLLNESWAASTVFFVQYDEGVFPNGAQDPSGYAGLDGGHVYFSAVSPFTHGDALYASNASAYNLLATTEWLLGLGNLGKNDSSPTFPAMTSLFHFPSSSPGNATVTFQESGLPVSTPTPNGSGGGLHLVVEALASNTSEVQNVISLASYLRPGDTVDLYDYALGLTPNPSLVNEVASEVRAVVPAGVNVTAHTGLVGNVRTLASGSASSVQGLAATYEPQGATAPGTYNFSACLKNFSEDAKIAHTAGLLAIAYPTGAPLLGTSLQSYGWNYGRIAQVTDRVWVETQQYAMEAVNDSTVWTTALSTLESQFRGAGEPLSKLAVQVTLGNDNHGTGTDPAIAAVAIRDAVAAGLDNVYIWTALGANGELATLLADLNRTSSAPQGTGSAGTAVPWAVTMGGVEHQSNGSTISFSVPNGTYAYSVSSPTDAANGTWYVASPQSGSVTVASANVSVGITFLPQSYYAVTGAITDTGGTVPGGVSLTWANGATSGSVPVSAGGSFSVDLANGTYAFTATAPGYLPASTSVVVSGGPVAAVDLVLNSNSSSAAVYPISGTVVNGSSELPIGGATLLVEGPTATENVTANATGAFSVDLSNASYGVRIAAAGYVPIFGSWSVQGGGHPFRPEFGHQGRFSDVRSCSITRP